MYNSIKKKAFTMIELMIVIALIAVLSAILIPKAKIHFEESRRVGVDRNRALLETLVRTEYEKPHSKIETEEETIDRIYQNLSKNQDLKEMFNPYNKNHKEVGFVKGNTIIDKNNAGYVFTKEPNKEDLSKGDVYVVIKDNQITTGTIPDSETGEEDPDPLPTTLKLPINSCSSSSMIIFNGNLYAWGFNSFGQLGTGDKIEKLIPTLVNLPNSVKPISISIGGLHAAAIGDDGNLYTWGDNGRGQLGTGNTIGTSTPTLINLPNGAKPTSIAIGNQHSAAIGDDGNLYAWGYNYDGQLGIGTTSNRLSPTRIFFPNGVKPITIYLGYYHTAAIGNDGNLYVWGNNMYGQLGTGDTINKSSPTLVNLPNSAKPTSISLGYYHSTVVGDDGNLYAWGYNNRGQLGTGDKINKSVPTTVNIPNGVKPTLISLGNYHSTTIGDDGNLYTWGYNDCGQLGTGDKIERLIPTLITLPNAVKPTSIFLGTTYSVAIGADGNLYTWGSNTNGQLGIGNKIDKATPIIVTIPN